MINMENFESKITFEIPTNLDFDSLVQSNNFTFLLSNGIVPAGGDGHHQHNNGFDPFNDPNYHRFISDIWVGIVLTLMILSTVFCLCSCFLYHKFRQWKRNVYDTQLANQQQTVHIEHGASPYDIESLPSYTLVSGLPSYDAAIEQIKTNSKNSNDNAKVHRPSIIKLFNFENEREEQKYRFTISSATLDDDENSARLEEPVPSYNEVVKLTVKVPVEETARPGISAKLLNSVPSYEEALFQFQHHQKVPLLGERRSISIDNSSIDRSAISYTEYPVTRYCLHHSKQVQNSNSNSASSSTSRNDF